MRTDTGVQLHHLLKQLTEALMKAVIVTEELRRATAAEIGLNARFGNTTSLPNTGTVNGCPIVDESTFAVHWKGKTVVLKNTRQFRLMYRLARNPNQYVTHLDLLHDVWENEDLAIATVRSVARHLRDRLRRGGLQELAAAIVGHNGHYTLSIN
ncbi:MAG: hypothetical protein C0483_21570 [Pirellula sp.]|nr:hypothetical protein [Pirellula sp.]